MGVVKRDEIVREYALRKGFARKELTIEDGDSPRRDMDVC